MKNIIKKLTVRGKQIASYNKGIILYSSIVSILTSPTVSWSESGLVFEDIATDSGSGFVYERVPSPEFENLKRLRQEPLVFNPLDPATFENIAQFPQLARGLPGVAILDYDSDGDMDIYVTNGPDKSNSLFSNQLIETGNLSFIDMAEHAGVTAKGQNSSGVCYGDIDNDGDHDLFVMGWGEPTRVFENKGYGKFKDITTKANMRDGDYNSSSCSIGDVNGDGLVDITIANSMPMEDSVAGWIVPFELNQHNQLFMNSGNNKFVDVSQESGIRHHAGFLPEYADSGAVTWGITMVDYDTDGDLDIIVADDQVFIFTENLGGYDRGLIHVFKNDGSGYFTDVAIEANTDKPTAWMGLSFGDINCDGNIDMFGSNAGDHIIDFVRRGSFNMPYELGEYASRWFLGKGDGTFDDPGVGSLVATPFSWGTSMRDYDNDGDTDIIFYGDIDAISVTTATNPGSILENQDCSAVFTLDEKAIPKDHSKRTVHGLATGDLNNDGFIDIVSVSNFDKPDSAPLLSMGINYGSPFDKFAKIVPQFAPSDVPGVLNWTGITYPNGTLSVEVSSADNNNNWVKVIAKGSVGIVDKASVNRDGIGSIVSFTPKHGKTSAHPVLGGSSHLSQDSLTNTFGLGDKDKGTVDIFWPGTGVKNRLYNVKAGETITFYEIPCSYDQTYDDDDYKKCVKNSLKELKESGFVTKRMSKRYLSSALRAYEESNEHHDHEDNDDD